jgi:hypothetical protein
MIDELKDSSESILRPLRCAPNHRSRLSLVVDQFTGSNHEHRASDAADRLHRGVGQKVYAADAASGCTACDA